MMAVGNGTAPPKEGIFDGYWLSGMTCSNVDIEAAYRWDTSAAARIADLEAKVDSLLKRPSSEHDTRQRREKGKEHKEEDHRRRSEELLGDEAKTFNHMKAERDVEAYGHGDSDGGGDDDEGPPGTRQSAGKAKLVAAINKYTGLHLQLPEIVRSRRTSLKGEDREGLLNSIQDELEQRAFGSYYCYTQFTLVHTRLTGKLVLNTFAAYAAALIQCYVLVTVLDTKSINFDNRNVDADNYRDASKRGRRRPDAAAAGGTPQPAPRVGTTRRTRTRRARRRRRTGWS